MNLAEAITRAHARGDEAERNRLLAFANDGASLRELAALLGVALNTAHRWTVAGREENPCSRLDSPAPTSTIVATTNCPRAVVAAGGVATRSTP